jgi:hypothetical protein
LPLKNHAEALLSANAPAYWPTSIGARSTIIISSLTLLFVFYPLVLAWPSIVFVARATWRKSASADWDRFIHACISLLACLEKSKTEAARESQGAIESALSLVAPAGAERDLAIEHARAVFERDIEEIRKSAAALALELHNEEGRLWNAAAYAGAEWDSPAWESWTPDPSPEFAARLGTFSVVAPPLTPRHSEIDLRFRLPALIPFAEGRCLLFNTIGQGAQAATAAMQSVVIRALANTPPGKARFTFIDPVGLVV